MRIDELTGYEQFQSSDRNIEDVVHHMVTELGYKLIGSGTYAYTLEHPNGYIIKVVDNDKCYRNFIDYCKNNRSNPHLPKFKSFRPLFLNPLENIFAIRMEKLEPVDFDFSLQLKDWLTDLERANDTKAKKTVFDNIFYKKNNELLDTLLDLQHQLPNNCKMDVRFNYDNVLQRNNGTKVISDPWAKED